MPEQSVSVAAGSVTFSNTLPFVLIAGPCQIETAEHAYAMACALKEITGKLAIPFVFKTSFDKANRTSGRSARGIGLAAALPVFEKIRNDLSVPILTDVHLPEQCAKIAPFVDILQIPAFLCRQTDLLTAAAQTGRVVNVKKGQFLAPQDMCYVRDKLQDAGNKRILFTERGTSFGYRCLVNDFRALPIMAQMDVPVIFDATHSVQEPGTCEGSSGGVRVFVAPLARAAVAVGVAGVFIETHDAPDQAFSDGPTMIPLQEMEEVLRSLIEIDTISKKKVC